VTYLADDSGIATSKPVEIYEFTDTKLRVDYRTSYQRDFVFGGHTYLATPGIKRGATPITGGADQKEATCELAMTDEIVSAYCGAGVPPQNWQLKIIRVQRTSNASEQVFSGPIRSCDLSGSLETGRIAVFTATWATDSGQELPVPNVIISKLCNHVLYDAQCQISRIGNSISPTISNISGRVITISSLGAFTASDLKFGEILHATSGERRSIVSISGLDVTLDVRLPTGGRYPAANGQAMQLFKGCDRTAQTCRDKFNNIGNFGGHNQRSDGNTFWPDLLTKLKGQT
jgi:uncharacterized phage protein (TIGR02218 family)